MSVPVQTIDGLEGLQSIFGEIEQQLNDADYMPTLGEMLPVLEETHQQHFDSRQSPTGQPWQDWHFTSLDMGEHPTLEASKRLRGSLRTGDTDSINGVGRRELQWGTGVEYAGIHNFGATIRTGTWLKSRDGKVSLPPGTVLQIPQREFLGMNEKTVGEIVGMSADAAVETMKPE